MDPVTTPRAAPTRSPATGASRRRRPPVVILDAGLSAVVVVLGRGARVAVGALLRHGGQTWRVRGFRAAVRAWVAEPVEH